MNVLSSIAPLELSQEAKSPWIQFVICFTLSFLCIFFAYSIWTKSIVGKKEELLNGLIEYQKKEFKKRWNQNVILRNKLSEG